MSNATTATADQLANITRRAGGSAAAFGLLPDQMLAIAGAAKEAAVALVRWFNAQTPATRPAAVEGAMVSESVSVLRAERERERGRQRGRGAQ
jgi:hypothetical protein